jgi:hypothetical protein
VQHAQTGQGEEEATSVAGKPMLAFTGQIRNAPSANNIRQQFALRQESMRNVNVTLSSSLFYLLITRRTRALKVVKPQRQCFRCGA